jgi:hypothetical protein
MFLNDFVAVLQRVGAIHRVAHQLRVALLDRFAEVGRRLAAA